MEGSLVVLVVPLLYMIVVAFLGLGPWSRLSRVAIADYYKVGAGVALPLVYLGIAGGYHSSFAIPGSMGFVYAHGVGWVANGLWTLFAAAAVFLTIGPRLNVLAKKFDYMTPADLIVDYFDGSDLLRILVSVIAIGFTFGYMMTNTMGPAILISSATGGKIPYNLACAVFVGLTTLYVCKSGIRGVMWTTVLQALWMFVALWTAAIFCIALVGGVGPMMTTIAREYPGALTIPGLRGFLKYPTWTTWAFICIGIGGSLKPCVWPFFYTAKDAKQSKILGATLPIYLAGIYVPVVFIGFACLLLVPGLQGVKADESFMMMLSRYAPAWFTGIILAGAVGAGMSTLDAEMNVAGAMLNSDIYRRYIVRNASESHYLLAGRVFAICFGIITYILTQYRFDIMVLISTLVNALVALYFPAVIGALFDLPGIRFTTPGVIAGILVALPVMYVTAMVKPYVNPMGVHYAAWSLLANFLTIFVVGLFAKEPDAERRSRIRGTIRDHLFAVRR